MQVPIPILLKTALHRTSYERLFIELNRSLGRWITKKITYHHRAFGKEIQNTEAFKFIESKHNKSRSLTQKIMGIMFFQISAATKENGGTIVHIGMNLDLDSITDLYCKSLSNCTYSYVRVLNEEKIIELMSSFVKPKFNLETARTICPDIEAIIFDSYDPQEFQKCIQKIMATLKEVWVVKKTAYNEKHHNWYVKRRAKYQPLVMD